MAPLCAFVPSAGPDAAELPPAPVVAVPVAELVELAAPVPPPAPFAVADDAPVPPETALPAAIASASPELPPLLVPRTAPDDPDMTMRAMPPVPPPPLDVPVSPVVP